MTLETIYYIGQTIAVVALIISLIFVGLQVRHSGQQTAQANQLARAENRREVIQQFNAIYKLFVEHPDTLNQIRACYQDYENADAEAQVIFAHTVHQFLNFLEQALFLDREGLMDAETFSGIENAALVNLVTPGGREFWAQTKRLYNQGLSKHVDKLLETRAADIPPIDKVSFFGPIKISTAGDLKTPKPEGNTHLS